MADGGPPRVIDAASDDRKMGLQLFAKRQSLSAECPVPGVGFSLLQAFKACHEPVVGEVVAAHPVVIVQPRNPPFSLGIGPEITGKVEVVKPTGPASAETRQTRSASQRARTCGQSTAFGEMTSLNSGV